MDAITAEDRVQLKVSDLETLMKEAEAHYKNGWVTVQGADAVIADK